LKIDQNDLNVNQLLKDSYLNSKIMIYKLSYTFKKIWILEEFIGNKPIKYHCTIGMCIDEQGYCPMCGHGAQRIEKLLGYEEWKIKYDSRKIIPLTTDRGILKIFLKDKFNGTHISENEFFIKDNIAYPIIQLTL
jgi:hypothetical protein